VNVREKLEVALRALIGVSLFAVLFTVIYLTRDKPPWNFYYTWLIKFQGKDFERHRRLAARELFVVVVVGWMGVAILILRLLFSS